MLLLLLSRLSLLLNLLLLQQCRLLLLLLLLGIPHRPRSSTGGSSSSSSSGVPDSSTGPGRIYLGLQPSLSLLQLGNLLLRRCHGLLLLLLLLWRRTRLRLVLTAGIRATLTGRRSSWCC